MTTAKKSPGLASRRIVGVGCAFEEKLFLDVYIVRQIFGGCEERTIVRDVSSLRVDGDRAVQHWSNSVLGDRGECDTAQRNHT